MRPNMKEKCPDCNPTRAVKNGKRYAKQWDMAHQTWKMVPSAQQYRCRVCNNNFSVPLLSNRSRLRSANLQQQFFELHFIHCISARQCADKLSIGTATAQRWRTQWLKKINAYLSANDPYLEAMLAPFHLYLSLKEDN